ncbi:MAG TPA: hypothetical protein VKU41_29430 [Polyangiaceae bacterium]|nr:hypothetical protein [Polyangiaceae bacterium]
MAVATCASPGKATPGPADMHCATQGSDGGVLIQTTVPASCCFSPDGGALAAACDVDAGDTGGCPYGSTMWGMKGDDDDCKYHVTWTSTSICETPDGGTNGVEFTVTAVKQTDGSPVTGGMYMMEAFTTSPGDAGDPNYCDNTSMHPSPTTNTAMTETSPGTGVYKVNMVFDKAGQWTIRFHFHEECADVLGTSPHGHAAFYLTVP